MGMEHRGKVSGHIRICNGHFSVQSFVPSTNFQLKKDAVPTLYPAAQSLQAPSQGMSDMSFISLCCAR